MRYLKFILSFLAAACDLVFDLTLGAVAGAVHGISDIWAAELLEFSTSVDRARDAFKEAGK